METTKDSYYNADEGMDMVGESDLDLANMDPEQRAKLEEEWKTELMKTEEEIQTLRQVLSSKVKHAQELKRKMGITVWKEYTTDLAQGVKNIQESTAGGLTSSIGMFTAPAYQKTSDAVKGVGEKTTSIFGGLGGSFARKLGEVKTSTAFKSFEERVGTAVTSVKTKMTGSRSNSTNSFEEALNSMEAQRAQQQQATPATTPNADNKPIS